MDRLERITLPAAPAPDRKDEDRQAAILKLWEAYGLIEDEAARQLIAFAIDRLVS